MRMDTLISGPLAPTLLWRERARHWYGNRPGGKLCPLKRARWRIGGCDAEDVQSEGINKKNKNESIKLGEPHP